MSRHLGAAQDPRAVGATGVVRPPTQDLSLLAIGVLGSSTAGPLIAATAAPALAIAFWRNGLGALVVIPCALLRNRSEFRRLTLPILGLALLAGVFLAVHFATYTPSLRYTSVASATALVCSQAVWAGIFSRLLGERLPRQAWAGTGLALLGVLLVTGVDVSLSSRALGGDGLALLGGVFGGAYIVAGSRVRLHLSTIAYTSLCYGACATLLLALCVLAGQPLAGYATEDWVRIAALTVCAQLLGHSLFNLVLRSTSPTLVSLATLFTVPVSATLAALLLGQTPPPAAVPALVLLVAGTGLVVSARDRVAQVAPVE
ncbi:MAG: DMT family transporter [Solirubrobacterales bacterium]|nr:DMT family transporter [Solirubrobacterales bacterium]